MWERFSFYGIRPLLVALHDRRARRRRRVRLRSHDGRRRSSASTRRRSISRRCPAAGSPTDGSDCSARSGAAACSSRSATSRSRSRACFGKPVFFLGLDSHRDGHRAAQAEHLGDGRRSVSRRRRAPRRGFSIFYMGINLGAMLGPLVTGCLARRAPASTRASAPPASACSPASSAYTLRAKRDARPDRHASRAATTSQQRAVKIVVALFARRGHRGHRARERRHHHDQSDSRRAQHGVSSRSAPRCCTSPTCSSSPDSIGDEMKRVAVIVVLFVFAADLLVGLRAGADVAQSVREGLHRPHTCSASKCRRVAPGR